MKKIVNFHLAKKRRDTADEIMKELHEASDPLEEIKQKTKVHKYHFWKKVIGGVLIAGVVGTIMYFIFKYQTYENVGVVTLAEHQEGDTSSYTEYAGGILKYSRDGIAFLNEKGREIWNQSCQMKNPGIEKCKGTIAVGDRGGTSLFVFQKDGVKGEIQTTSPIQQFTVSEQGIVGVILKNELTPQIICYDAKGNILVEQNASLSNTGYPIDLAISNDGETLLVAYVHTNGNNVVSKTVYYNFNKAGEGKKNHIVAENEFENSLIPVVGFLDSRTSVLVGQDVLVFNRGLDKPQELKRIKIKKEIKSIAYNKSGIALILKNSGETGYELRTYNANGEQVLTVGFEGEYGNIKLTDKQVILFDGEKCSIYSQAGVHKFDGKMESRILEIFPKTGFNKYMMISADGFQEAQLTK